MTIEEFLRFLLRNAFLLVVAALIGGAAGYAYSYTKPEVYQASALGYVSVSAETDPEGNPISQASSNMQFQYSKAQTYLPLFGTRAVGQNIVDATGLPISADAAAGSLTATLDPNAPIITVVATGGSPEQASTIANAAVEAAAKEAQRLETGGNENAKAGVALVPYQAANPPGAPIAPDRKKLAAFGAAAALLLALGVAWLRMRNDSRIRSAEDLEKASGVGVLGMLPIAKELTRTKQGSFPEPKDFHTREALRKLRTNLRFVDVDNPPHSVVVTSSVPAEGKSTVVANLARVLARSGQKTLLIDADMRRPVIAKGFEIDGEVGLSQMLAGSVTADDAIQRIGDTRLWVLPAGQIPPNPSELLGSRRMHDLVAEMSKDYFVIIDAPPVLAVTDAQLLSRHTDGAILVSMPGRSRAESVAKAVEAIRVVGGTVFGMVLNQASTSRIKRLAYGDSGYGYATYGAYSYGSKRKKGYAYATAEPTLDEALPGEAAVPDRDSAAGAGHTPSDAGRGTVDRDDEPSTVRRRRARRAATPVDGGETSS